MPFITIRNLPPTIHKPLLQKILDANRIDWRRIAFSDEESTNAAKIAHVQLEEGGNGAALRILNSCEVSDRVLQACEADERAAELLQSSSSKKERVLAEPDPIDLEPAVDYDQHRLPFASLNLSEPILRNIEKLGFEKCTPIQGLAIPSAMEGRDLIGRAQTGSGKTIAFAIPIAERLLRTPGSGVRALVLAPTRELAVQINESMDEVIQDTGLNSIVVYGGENILDQMIELRNDINIVIATPGRLLDLQGRGRLRFDAAEILVLDEADRMLDMGFMPQIRSILSCFYDHPQTLLFSATMPPEVRKLTEGWLVDPANIEVGQRKLRPLDEVQQEVFYLTQEDKERELYRLLDDEAGTVIVFTKTKRGAERLSQRLKSKGFPATRIHGDIEQSDRMKAVEAFKSGVKRILVATDVAARGLHIDGVAHIVNFDMPQSPEDHMHRIGRTARAGAKGKATTFITPQEKRKMKGFRGVMGEK